NVLRVIANPDDSIAAFHVLGDPLYGVDPVDLARLAARAQRRNAGLLGSALAAAPGPGSQLPEPSRAAIRRVRAPPPPLAASAVRRATTEVMFEFAEASGLLGQLASADSPESIEQANNLNKLFHIAARIGPLLKTDRVGPFVVHLGLLIDAGDDPAAA